MIKRVAENGSIYHEPPYTAEEEADFYRRIDNGGPITIVRSHRGVAAGPAPAGAPPAAPSQEPPRRPPAE